MTDTLFSIIRQQRHLGTRVMIATQEPTLSPTLLDLCNMTIIHRFTSPAWFKTIKSHIAGAASDKTESNDAEDNLFRRIVSLHTGEALLFCPAGLLDVEEKVDSHKEDNTSDDSSTVSSEEESEDSFSVARDKRAVALRSKYAHLQIRKRITADGGRSLIEK